ncbi:MAG: hypothetical protein ACD_16C00248G0016 [uncultured bacterium]|nr:MAG: hypothetical protein ACD_16C00248G0016 [uncultured bacterium]
MMFPPYFFPLLSAGNKHTYKTHVIKPTKRSMSPDSNCSFIEDTSVLSSKTSTIDKLIDNKGEKTNPKKITGTLKAIKNLKKLTKQLLTQYLSCKAFLDKRCSLVIHGYLLVIVFTFFVFNMPSKACSGRFVNPLTEICWSCLFPLSIGATKVSSGGGREDTPNPSQIPCFCPRPPWPTPVPGIPIGFWEPARLVDVTRTPYCMVNMGGMQLTKSQIGQGVHGANGGRRTQNSFYQVHWYIYPVIYWLELLVDFICLEKGDFDVGYLTELDPLWNDDELSFILNPEAVLFGNPLAQAACAADCTAATAHLPLDTLFWCNGCQGSLYPFTGNNVAHNGGVQGSLLMVGRIMAKLHRELLLWGTSGRLGLCQKYPLPIIKKTQYRTQMTYPRPVTRGPLACPPLGRTEVIWGSGREFPYKGEDFGYLIWRKKNCCVF